MAAIVLVADPDPFNLRLLEEVCSAAGYQVLSAADGPEILSMVARQIPDLALMDAEMPMMDGFEILRILKGDADLRTIPVVMVTKADDVEGRSRAIQLGAEDFLTKPYRVFEIQQRVRNVLRATRRDRLGIAPTVPPADQRDPVTGAGTPSQLIMSLDYEHTRATRYGQSLTCIVIRIRNLPDLAEIAEDGNTDKIVAGVGESLRNCIRGVDHFFRLKRDEFCILLPETDRTGAETVVERIETIRRGGGLSINGSLRPELRWALATAPSPDIKSGEDLLAKARIGIDH